MEHSRWIFGAGTGKDFAVAKPKCAFGGNGNPVYLLGSRPLLPQEAAQSGNFGWAESLIPLDHGLSISRPESFWLISDGLYSFFKMVVPPAEPQLSEGEKLTEFPLN